MALEPLPGFKSLVTHHCVTGSMRHIYEFHHHPVSEEMLLGIGSGVGFIYWHMKGVPPIIGGRANVARPGEEGLEITAGRRTGVRVERRFTQSPRKAEAALVEMLEAGEPAMLYVDMGFLPYFESLPDDYHFGGHVIVVGGYDPGSRATLVADRDADLHPVSMADLAKARGSKFKPFPPMNTWLTFDFAHKSMPTPAQCYEAIGDCARAMLHGPISNIGVRGIYRAAQEIQRWPSIMDEDGLRQACFNAFIFIDPTGGTGGGIFRYMYGRFLHEVAQLTGDGRLADLGEEMRSIGDRWQEIAAIFRAASEGPHPEALLRDACGQIAAVAGCEQAAWKQLEALVIPT